MRWKPYRRQYGYPRILKWSCSCLHFPLRITCQSSRVEISKSDLSSGDAGIELHFFWHKDPQHLCIVLNES